MTFYVKVQNDCLHWCLTGATSAFRRMWTWMWGIKQQVPDLSSDGSDAARRATNNAENRGGLQREKPVALRPTIGDGR